MIVQPERIYRQKFDAPATPSPLFNTVPTLVPNDITDITFQLLYL